LSQLRADDQLIVVDNASSDDTVARAQRLAPQAIVQRNEHNAGFAGGVNAGAAYARADLLLLLNPDAVIQPGALELLRSAALKHPDWGAWQALVVMTRDGQHVVNSAGNTVHYLGFGWAGRLGEPVDALPGDDEQPGFLSGAALMVRSELWRRLGGFDKRYFMYGEDLDLSLRLRLAGYKLGFVPDSQLVHDYDFDKGAYKWRYLERNRWWTLIGVYPLRILIALLPALLAFELALLVAAARGGWLKAKLRAHRDVLGELPAILARRMSIQRTRAITPAEFAAGLTAGLDSPVLAGARSIPGLQGALKLYWAIVVWMTK
jgi:GT2 family glycosyltransferase